MLCMLSGNFCIIMRYDFDGSKSATIFLARLSAIIERSTIHYGRGCRSQVSMLIKSIDRIYLLLVPASMPVLHRGWFELIVMENLSCVIIQKKKLAVLMLGCIGRFSKER